MVLPTTNQALRAKATQRLNVFEKNLADVPRVRSRLVQLLLAELCYNLDMERLKDHMEKSL